MASLALQKSTNERVKALAQKNVESQTRESSQMSKWLESWHNDRPQVIAEDEPSKKKMMRQMEELRAASGAEFDHKFLKTFTEHHQEAIHMAQLPKEKNVRQDLAQLSEKMIQDQKRDVEEMKRLQHSPGASAATR